MDYKHVDHSPGIKCINLLVFCFSIEAVLKALERCFSKSVLSVTRRWLLNILLYRGLFSLGNCLTFSDILISNAFFSFALTEVSLLD